VQVLIFQHVTEVLNSAVHQDAKVVSADAKFVADIVFFHFLEEDAANQVALARKPMILWLP